MVSHSRRDGRGRRLAKLAKPSRSALDMKQGDTKPPLNAFVASEPLDSPAVLVPAAVRTLRVLEAFERFGQPLTLSKLAEEIEVPISSCHNLIRTLIARGYLFSLESQRTFYPTRRVWDLANAIVAHDPVLQRILPVLEQLRDKTSETIIIGKRQDQIALYLLVLESPQNVRYVASSGRTIPLHTSAIGKALLSTLDNKGLSQWLGGRRLQKVTSKSIVDCDELEKDINAGKLHGHFITAGENVPDVGAIACPLRLAGEAFAIAVAGPTGRIQDSRQRIVRQLKETVETLERNVIG
jgi:DNA-binding IclR family transcriptional regulator